MADSPVNAAAASHVVRDLVDSHGTLKLSRADADAVFDMYCNDDRWRELSRQAGERREAPPRIVRFSRRLLIVSALFLIVIGVLDLI